MDGAQGGDQRLHGVGEIVIGPDAIGEQGVAPHRRDHLAMQEGGGGGLSLEAPVGMPAGPEIGSLLVRLPAQLQHVRMAGHGGDERVDPELADPQGEGLQLLKGQRLVGKAHHRVPRPGVADLGQGLGQQGPGEVHADDLGAEAGLGGKDLERAIGGRRGFQHDCAPRGAPHWDKGFCL